MALLLLGSHDVNKPSLTTDPKFLESLKPRHQTSPPPSPTLFISTLYHSDGNLTIVTYTSCGVWAALANYGNGNEKGLMGGEKSHPPPSRPTGRCQESQQWKTSYLRERSHPVSDTQTPYPERRAEHSVSSRTETGSGVCVVTHRLDLDASPSVLLL